MVLLVAVAGPWLAPHDPQERFSVLQINGVWTGPPFPAFTPGFLLGTDGAGRDLFSRLLWGVRPTLIMVTIIALVRLLVALVVGTAAGWARGWPAALLDALTTGALLAPVLVVALAVIAFVGIQRGLLAFILGLTLTGWAESARYVETQTRALRDLPFMEAARTAGASDIELVVGHVLRHILPQMGMLLAAEMSATLMVTAALGFLGYFIGGGVWVTVTDFAARNEAANPELGQLLATSLERIFQPWPMVVVGGTVVLIVLGFNLLGDGLRRQMDESHGRRTTRIERALSRLTELLALRHAPALPVGGADTATIAPTAGWRRPGRMALSAAGALAGLLLVAWWLWPAQATPTPGALIAATGPGWSAERRDASGTLTVAESGLLSPTVAWSYTHTAGFSGGPVVDAGGNLYIAATDPALLALDAQGALRWQAPLPAAPVGAPALGADGRVYVVDTDRGLTAFDSNGAQLWHFTAEEGPRPSSGPIVDGARSDGRIYFAQAARVRAVDREGGNLWLTQAGQNVSSLPPRLSPDGAQLFLLDGAYAAADGTALPSPVAAGAEFVVPLPGYVVGADGGVYFVQGTSATLMDFTSGAPTPVRAVAFDAGGLNVYLPSDAGMTADGVFWLFFGNPYMRAHMIWVDSNGRLLRNIELPLAGARLLGMDANDRAYVCSEQGAPRCMAVAVPQKTPLWELTMPGGTGLAGGALAQEALYVATRDGVLHALHDAPAPAVAAATEAGN
jgi:peptide/nickel transport system permease protein